MWAEKTKSGKYKYVERYLDPMTGKYRKISVTLEKGTAQAKKIAQRYLDEKMEKSTKETGNVCTLQELRAAWIQANENVWKPTTLANNSTQSKLIFQNLGWDTLVSRLSARYVSDHIMASGEKCNKKRRITEFKKVMRWGFRHDYVRDITWLDKLETSQEKSKDDVEGKFLENSECEKLLVGINNEIYQDLTLFLLLTGCRIGEALALTAKDIDLKGRVIHITKGLYSAKKIVTTPKTSSSVRDIYIQDELFPLCKKLQKQAKVSSLRQNCDLLFQKNGDFLSYRTYERNLMTAGQKALRRKVTPHMLRHTHASLLAEKGVEIGTISRRLGHENSQITRQIYLHVTKRVKERDKEKVKEVCFF